MYVLTKTDRRVLALFQRGPTLAWYTTDLLTATKLDPTKLAISLIFLVREGFLVDFREGVDPKIRTPRRGYRLNPNRETT